MSDEITLDATDRPSGTYVLGRPGTGKSTFLVNSAITDYRDGNSIFFLDPHGQAIRDFLFRTPAIVKKYHPTTTVNNKPSFLIHFDDNAENIYLLDPTHEGYAFGINPLVCSDVSSLTERSRAYNKTFNIFRKLWGNEWGVWLELILQNTLPVFIELQDFTLAEIPLFLTSRDFRQALLKRVRYNRSAVDFWRYEFKEEQAQSALVRIRSILSNPYVRDIVGQKQTTLNFERSVTQYYSILLRLPAMLAEDAKRFIGTIFLSELTEAIFRRPTGHNLGVYVDEFQHFATSDFAKLILESRKFKACLTLAHQERVGQFGENQEILSATMACGTKIIYQCTPRDAQELAPEFARVASDEAVRRGGELVLSAHPVEDIWTRGHIDPNVMTLRQKYFWVVDLLKAGAHEEYVFDPHNRRIQTDVNTFSPNWSLFRDGQTYRTSGTMLKEAIDLLNHYYHDRMRNKYGHNKPITDEEVHLLFQVIVRIGGMWGMFPTMMPHMRDDAKMRFMHTFRQDLLQSVRAEEASQESIYRQEIDNRIRQGSTNFTTPEMDKVLSDIGIKRTMLESGMKHSDIEGRLEKIGEFMPGMMDQTKRAAVTMGMTGHEAEGLFEWRERERFEREDNLLKTVIRNALSTTRRESKPSKKEMDEFGKTELPYIHLIAMIYIEMNHPNATEPQTRDYYGNAVERGMWQVAEIKAFLMYCINYLSWSIEEKPVQSTTNVYEENLKRERSQTDLNAEMALELSNLPRYHAHIKTPRGKWYTVAMPSLDEQRRARDFEAQIVKQTCERVCRPRVEIEQELAARRSQWRGSGGEEPPPRFT